MKVYLQDVETGSYFQGHGKWTSTREEALNFHNVLDALDLLQNLQTMNVEVLLGLDHGQEDIRLSLGCMGSTVPRPTKSLSAFTSSKIEPRRLAA